jgi:hypothetical protein
LIVDRPPAKSGVCGSGAAGGGGCAVGELMGVRERF